MIQEPGSPPIQVEAGSRKPTAPPPDIQQITTETVTAPPPPATGGPNVWRPIEPGEDIRTYTASVDAPAKLHALAVTLTRLPTNSGRQGFLRIWGEMHGDEARQALRLAVWALMKESKPA